MGTWANMCQLHFESTGSGLGTGRGQRLVLESEVVHLWEDSRSVCGQGVRPTEPEPIDQTNCMTCIQFVSSGILYRYGCNHTVFYQHLTRKQLGDRVQQTPGLCGECWKVAHTVLDVDPAKDKLRFGVGGGLMMPPNDVGRTALDMDYAEVELRYAAAQGLGIEMPTNKVLDYTEMALAISRGKVRKNDGGLLLRFDTESLLPSTECEGDEDSECNCPGGCSENSQIASQCTCSLGSGCYCGCDPNSDVQEYRLGSLIHILDCPDGDGWVLEDDGTMDTVVRVMDGYAVNDDGSIVKV